jgi:hypothetical protein
MRATFVFAPVALPFTLSPSFAGSWVNEFCPIGGCHAETHGANSFVVIRLETRSRTVALRVHCRFGCRPGLRPLECRPMKNRQTSFSRGQIARRGAIVPDAEHGAPPGSVFGGGPQRRWQMAHRSFLPRYDRGLHRPLTCPRIAPALPLPRAQPQLARLIDDLKKERKDRVSGRSPGLNLPAPIAAA